jgi:hypothetical protein
MLKPGQPEYSYVGRCKCGAIMGAVVDMPDDKKTVANWVRDMILSGLNIERVGTVQVRLEGWNCTCEKQQALGI